jgi:hypothetical protein
MVDREDLDRGLCDPADQRFRDFAGALPLHSGADFGEVFAVRTLAESISAVQQSARCREGRSQDVRDALNDPSGRATGRRDQHQPDLLGSAGACLLSTLRLISARFVLAGQTTRPRATPPLKRALTRPVRREERVQQGRTLTLQHAPHHLRPVRQPPIPHHIPQRSHRPGPRLPSPENHPRHPSQHQRPSAHRARLNCHHQRAPTQPPPIPERSGRGTQRQHLSMRRRIPQRLTRIACRRQHLTRRRHHQRPDRHVGIG